MLVPIILLMLTTTMAVAGGPPKDFHARPGEDIFSVASGRPIIVSRERFDRIFIGKRKADIINLIGIPEYTSSFDNGKHESLRYQYVTYDKSTGRLDDYTLLEFNDGVVISISHF